MKKVLAFILAMILVVSCFAGCGKNTNSDKVQSDMEYVKEKGTLVVGITDFAPMDYKESGSDEWVGFDADMAKAFAEKLGVKVEFNEIEWDNKVFELDSKKIDCVWNGMTLTEEVTAAMSCSNAYCNNAQVVVVKADKAAQFKTEEDCKNLQFAVEAGSEVKKLQQRKDFLALLF